jgi:hypothetical protein
LLRFTPTDYDDLAARLRGGIHRAHRRGMGGSMFNRMSRLASTLSDYTVGTAIVLAHLALAGRSKNRDMPSVARRPRVMKWVGLARSRRGRPATVSSYRA